MKKYIMFLVTALTLAFTSCANNEEIDIVYRYDLSISINTSNICNNYGLTEFQELLGNGYNMGVTTLLYDSQGNFCKEMRSHANNLQPINQNFINLEEGDYTVINIQHIVNSSNNESPVWTIEGKEQLSTVKIVKTDKNLEQVLWYNCIGIHSETITIKCDKSLSLVPELSGAFIEFEYENYDKSKYNWLGVGFKNVADGIYLDPKLSKTESLYYDEYTEEGMWEICACFYNEDGLFSSEKEIVYVIETGHIKCSIAPSDYPGTGTIYVDGFYPSEDYYLDISAGNKYKAYSFYNSRKEVMDVYIDSLNGFDAWYQNFNKKNPFEPYIEWGASMSEVMNYMTEEGYVLDWDSETYLSFTGIYNGTTIRYTYKFDFTGLINSTVYISKKAIIFEELKKIMDDFYFDYVYSPGYSDGIHYYTSLETKIHLWEHMLDDEFYIHYEKNK